MSTRKLWTLEEDNNLRAAFRESQSWDEIMEIFNTDRTKSAVANRANFLGLRIHDDWMSPSTVKAILEAELSKNPTNIQEVFRKVAEQTHLKVGSIQKYYYSNDSYLSRKHLKTCFMLIGKKKAYKNTKNIEKNSRVSLWQKIKNKLRSEIWKKI